MRRRSRPKRSIRENKSRREAMQRADEAWQEYHGQQEVKDVIYLNGSEFAKRSHLGHDRIRSYVYEQLGLSDDEVETRTEDGDLYVTIPEGARE